MCKNIFLGNNNLTWPVIGCRVAHQLKYNDLYWEVFCALNVDKDLPLKDE